MSSYYLEVSNELKKIIKKLKREERINYPKLWLYLRLFLSFLVIWVISSLIGVSFLFDIKNSTNLSIYIKFLFAISAISGPGSIIFMICYLIKKV